MKGAAGLHSCFSVSRVRRGGSGETKEKEREKLRSLPRLFRLRGVSHGFASSGGSKARLLGHWVDGNSIEGGEGQRISGL